MGASEGVPAETKVLVLDMDMVRWTEKAYGALTEAERATVRQQGEVWMALTGPYAWTEDGALGARACLPPKGPALPVQVRRTKPMPGEFVVLLGADGSGVGMVPANFLSQAQQATLERRQSGGDVVPWWTAKADGEPEAEYLRAAHRSAVEIGGGLEARRDHWRGRAKAAEAALAIVAEMLAPYTTDGAQPRASDIPGILAVLLRQREDGAKAGVVGPVRVDPTADGVARTWHEPVAMVLKEREPSIFVYECPTCSNWKFRNRLGASAAVPACYGRGIDDGGMTSVERVRRAYNMANRMGAETANAPMLAQALEDTEAEVGRLAGKLRNVSDALDRLGVPGFVIAPGGNLARHADPDNAPAMSREVPLEERLSSLEGLRAQKDGAYRERNQLVALLARMALELGWMVGVGRHPDSDTTWDSDWRTIVFIDLPTGQASWHFHDSERHLLEGLPPYPGKWDGHTTDEKYDRVRHALKCGTAQMTGIPVLRHSLTVTGQLMAPGAPPPMVLRKEWFSSGPEARGSCPDCADEGATSGCPTCGRLPFVRPPPPSAPALVPPRHTGLVSSQAVVEAQEVGIIRVPDEAEEECPTCHQSGEGKGGEYPCATCGRNTLHDSEEA